MKKRFIKIVLDELGLRQADLFKAAKGELSRATISRACTIGNPEFDDLWMWKRWLKCSDDKYLTLIKKYFNQR